MVKSRIRVWLIDLPLVLAFLALAFFPWQNFFGAKVRLMDTLLPPSAEHPLGTDNLGRDLLVRVATTLADGVIPLWGAVTLSTLVGVAFGAGTILLTRRRLGAGAAKGFDLAATVLASVPVGVSAFAWAVWWEKGGLAPVCLALGALFAVRSYLQIRDLHRHDRHLAYWTAHHSLGGSEAGRLFRYGVLTGWRWSLVETLGFHLRAAVAIEASLSYLGFGIQEPAASFGNMLASHFDLYLKGHLHVLAVILAGLALTAAFPSCLLAVLANFPSRGRAREAVQIFAAAPEFKVR
jgi:peptide/nickel transport system permease protein